MESTPRYDTTFLNARREAALIFAVWVVLFLWSVPFCYHFGYGAGAETQGTVWGVPKWVVWGIGVPWLVADAFTIWLVTRYMGDDDLGEEERATGTEGTSVR